MKSARVIDSWALLAYLQGEKAGHNVTDLFKEAERHDEKLWMSVINWGEVLYIIESCYGAERKDQVEQLMRQLPMNIADADQERVQAAAHLKATSRLGYADCFAASLAFSLKTELITGDKDFRNLEGKLPIHWLQ